MLNQLFDKMKEALISVLPIMAIVLILSFSPLVSLTSYEIAVFIIASVFLIIGIGLFNHGAEIAMTPMGKSVGQGLSSTGNLGLLVGVCFFLGLFITIAEPDLQILAQQVGSIVGGEMLLKIVVGVGVGLFIVVMILKIISHGNLSMYLMYFYLFLFAIMSLTMASGNENLVPLCFDSGGVTTGPITVPFIMALGVGIAKTLGGKDAKGNSFGLVALCSVGSIFGVAILSVFAKGKIAYDGIPSEIGTNVFTPFLSQLPTVIKEVTISLGMVVLFFVLCDVFFLKLPKEKLYHLFIGIAFTYVGLIVFLTAVNAGFMSIGYSLGHQLATGSKTVIIILGFVIGFLVVMAEPAVRLLNSQVEEITNGMVSKRSMMIALTTGIGIAIALSVIRIIYKFSILYYLVPGYLISLGLSFFVPHIYTAIAFDSGGVASGPLTTGFILQFAIGACVSLHGVDSVMDYSYGIVAMVAMTPLITIQFLGFKAIMQKRIRRRRATMKLLDKDDGQIIRFV